MQVLQVSKSIVYCLNSTNMGDLQTQSRFQHRNMDHHNPWILVTLRLPSRLAPRFSSRFGIELGCGYRHGFLDFPRFSLLFTS